MVDSAEDAHFHWLASDGRRLSGSARELAVALGDGTLNATALVWRAGWAEWLPANRVAELASAVPEAARESTLKPRRDPSVVSPPTAPGEHMPAVAPRAPLSPPQRTSAPAGRTQPPPPPSRAKPNEAARDTLAPSSFGVIGGPRRGQPTATVVHREGTAPGAPLRGRSPLPTLSEESTVPSATATLRPPGAVPPPARGVPAVPALDSLSSGTFSFEKRSAVMTPIPAFGPPERDFEPVPPAGLPPRLAPEPTRPSAPETTPPAAMPRAEALTPKINESPAAVNALPSVVNKALLAKPEPAPVSIERPLDSKLAGLQRVPPEARRTPVEPMHAVRAPLNSASEDGLARALHRHSLLKIGRVAVDSRTVVMVLSALCGALLVALVALALSRSRASPLVTVAPVTASAPPAPPPVLGCRLAMPAALIAPNIERSVPPCATSLGAEPSLVLGFAATKTKGVGLRLKPDTLDVQPAFEEESKDAVRGVVPLTRSGSLAFFVDRDDDALRSAHTVDEIPPFTLGVNDAGFSRVVAGSMSLVWPLNASVRLTEPRAAEVGSFGYGVTFRRGGQTGAVVLGFVASDGAKKSELVEIPGAPKFLGTPTIAGSAAGALVAFAGRDAPEAAWKVFVSLTLPGAAPSAARELVTGSGGGAISPTLSALAPNRWLLQWTEGVSGQYQVRVQSFAADLSALGASVLVSPKGANAGQGALGAFAGGATALFILTSAGHDELWGATLSCP